MHPTGLGPMCKPAATKTAGTRPPPSPQTSKHAQEYGLTRTTGMRSRQPRHLSGLVGLRPVVYEDDSRSHARKVRPAPERLLREHRCASQTNSRHQQERGAGLKHWQHAARRMPHAARRTTTHGQQSTASSTPVIPSHPRTHMEKSETQELAKTQAGTPAYLDTP